MDFIGSLIETFRADAMKLHTQIDTLTERNTHLEQALRNYITALEAMPEWASGADYKRLLAPVQEYALELLEQEVKE